MTPFLKQIAEIYYKEFGSDISDITFVFPSRRAGKFFIEYIKNIVDQNILAPTCLTISDFFATLSPKLEKEDKVGLLFHLYEAYKTITNSDESFNKFIGIGEIILKDFNDIDNYLVNPKYIFSNIQEIKKYEKENILTQEQIECIKNFLNLFTEETIGYKQKTYELWCKMFDIYNEFKKNLLSKEICYEGMQHRMVVENSIPDNLLPKQVVFIGFNALDGCTKALFDILKSKNRADFYWDYDFKYAKISEDKYNKAHFFLEENIKKYKSKFNLEKEIYPETNINVIGCSSNIGQTKYVNSILNQILKDNDGTKTALVLSDESLLIPMLYSLPEDKNVNITMGYPIKYTNTYNFIDFFFLLHKNFKAGTGYNSTDTKTILSHPYMSKLCKKEIDNIDKNAFIQSYISKDKLLSDNELMNIVFNPQADKNIIENLITVIKYLKNIINIDLDIECLNQVQITANKVLALLQRYPDLVESNLHKIFINVLKITNLSFIGEPLSGLQIMGMLETRCLDFDNIIITSFNEGIFPKSDIGSSLIPYSIRKPYNIPTTDHQDAIFSYNFYRLIKRAKNVWCIYDTRNNNDNCTGEVSRFVKQLEYIYNVPINKSQIIHIPEIYKPSEIVINKSDEDILEIKNFLQNNGLSPSALNNYIECPLRFYYQNIKGINEDIENGISINAAQLGSILHLTMEQIYIPFKNKRVQTSDLEKITKQDIENITNKAFRCVIYNIKDFNDADKYTYDIVGENKILFTIIVEMVMNLLECDKKRTPFTHISEEKNYSIPYTTKKGNTIKLKGYIDKVDETEEAVHLIDYKTIRIKNINSTKVEDCTKLESFFYEKNDKKYVKEILQMCFYNLLYAKNTDKRIETYLFLSRMSYDHDNFLLNTLVELPDNWEATFKNELNKVIDDLLDKETPIKQTMVNENCKYCPFTPICGR